MSNFNYNSYISIITFYTLNILKQVRAFIYFNNSPGKRMTKTNVHIMGSNLVSKPSFSPSVYEEGDINQIKQQ